MRQFIILVMTLIFLPALGSFAQEEETRESHIVEVMALDYAFAAPEEIPSGWVTFRLNNEKSKEIHVIELGLLPEGVTYADFMETVPVWETITERVQDGELVGFRDVYAAAGPQLPKWYRSNFREVTSRGLVSPGHIADRTVYLEPGTYAMYCFVKSPDGQAHISKGMVKELVVTDDDNGASRPEADVELLIGVEEISEDGELSPGNNTISARFKYESLLLPAIHLIRVEDDTDLDQVGQWLDWYRKDGLKAPAPAKFLGGNVVHGWGPKEEVVYFSVKDLKPGRYAWVVSTFDYAFSETFTIK